MSKENLSISEKMVKLDELLAWFDGEDFELEEALARFSEAKQLATDIEQDLAVVKHNITVISEQFDRDAV